MVDVDVPLDEAELDEVELAVVAYQDDGRWEIDDLPDQALSGVGAIARELEKYAASAVALLSVGEDFALLVRAGDPARLVVSDLTAATEWSLARSATDALGLTVEDDDEPAPAGDLALLADLGLSAADLADLVDDEPHPDDLLVGIADELGFGDELEEILDSDDDEDGDDEDDGFDLIDDDAYDLGEDDEEDDELDGPDEEE